MEVKYSFGCIMMDITSNCNLRCKFCSNDWRSIRGDVNMTKETFGKALELLPLAINERFFLSCYLEPLIHPEYIQLLQMIPKEYRQKVFFTTNLARKLSAETLFELSEVNINHINISIDSLNPSVYESLRVGARFETVMDNIANMVSIFKRNPTVPKLRYIIMLFKQNMAEMEGIVRMCYDEYMAEQCEIRTPFNFTIRYMDKEWAKESLVSSQEWDDLKERLEILPYVRFFNPPSKPGVPQIGTVEKPINTNIRIDSGGAATLLGTGEKYNINDMANPCDFFHNKLCQIVTMMKGDS